MDKLKPTAAANLQADFRASGRFSYYVELLLKRISHESRGNETESAFFRHLR